MPKKNDVAKLTGAEKKTLAQCEETIRKGIASWYDTANALKIIRDEKLYRETHETWDAYCQDNWDISRSYAHRQIEAVQFVDKLATNDPIPEGQLRELVKAGDDAPKVWKEACRRAPKLASGKPCLSAKFIADVRDAMLNPKPEEKPKEETKPTSTKPKDSPPADEPSKPVNGIGTHDDDIPFEPPPDRVPGEDDGDEELDAKLGEIDQWDGAKLNQLLKAVTYYENKIVKAEAIITLRICRLFPHDGLPLKRWNDELASKTRDLKRFRQKLESIKTANKAGRAAAK